MLEHRAERRAATGGLDASANFAQEARDYAHCFPRDAQHMCAINASEKVLTVLLMACAYIYFGLYFYHLFQAMLKLKDLPRQDNKMASLQIRLQVRLADDVHPRSGPCTQPRGYAGFIDRSPALIKLVCAYAVQDPYPGDSILHPQHRAAVVCEAAGLPQLLLHLVWHAAGAGGLLRPIPQLSNVATFSDSPMLLRTL